MRTEESFQVYTKMNEEERVHSRSLSILLGKEGRLCQKEDLPFRVFTLSCPLGPGKLEVFLLTSFLFSGFYFLQTYEEVARF